MLWDAHPPRPSCVRIRGIINGLFRSRLPVLCTQLVPLTKVLHAMHCTAHAVRYTCV